ncbi:hypothetical protein PAPYR_468 [Paratrimastix pyriformis]|uniref:Uncharacterized protein n=1 Tax=Paratrimastix pyriformis TaxID=342808 RepID=A0ABQ8UY47_9EUKA|nr:hypothetical protein PAPYR_468 [Paratrimastix pyriformis]
MEISQPFTRSSRQASRKLRNLDRLVRFVVYALALFACVRASDLYRYEINLDHYLDSFANFMGHLRLQGQLDVSERSTGLIINTHHFQLYSGEPVALHPDQAMVSQIPETVFVEGKAHTLTAFWVPKDTTPVGLAVTRSLMAFFQYSLPSTTTSNGQPASSWSGPNPHHRGTTADYSLADSANPEVLSIRRHVTTHRGSLQTHHHTRWEDMTSAGVPRRATLTQSFVVADPGLGPHRATLSGLLGMPAVEAPTGGLETPTGAHNMLSHLSGQATLRLLDAQPGNGVSDAADDAAIPPAGYTRHLVGEEAPALHATTTGSCPLEGLEEVLRGLAGGLQAGREDVDVDVDDEGRLGAGEALGAALLEAVRAAERCADQRASALAGHLLGSWLHGHTRPARLHTLRTALGPHALSRVQQAPLAALWLPTEANGGLVDGGLATRWAEVEAVMSCSFEASEAYRELIGRVQMGCASENRTADPARCAAALTALGNAGPLPADTRRFVAPHLSATAEPILRAAALAAAPRAALWAPSLVSASLQPLLSDPSNPALQAAALQAAQETLCLAASHAHAALQGARLARPVEALAGLHRVALAAIEVRATADGQSESGHATSSSADRLFRSAAVAYLRATIPESALSPAQQATLVLWSAQKQGQEQETEMNGGDMMMVMDAEEAAGWPAEPFGEVATAVGGTGGTVLHYQAAHTTNPSHTIVHREEPLLHLSLVPIPRANTYLPTLWNRCWHLSLVPIPRANTYLPTLLLPHPSVARQENFKEANHLKLPDSNIRDIGGPGAHRARTVTFGGPTLGATATTRTVHYARRRAGVHGETFEVHLAAEVDATVQPQWVPTAPLLHVEAQFSGAFAFPNLLPTPNRTYADPAAPLTAPATRAVSMALGQLTAPLANTGPLLTNLDSQLATLVDTMQYWRDGCNGQMPLLTAALVSELFLQIPSPIWWQWDKTSTDRI